MHQRLQLEIADYQMKKKFQNKKKIGTSKATIAEKDLRKWLCQRGKSNILDFSDSEIRKLKECFNNLDGDGSGSIGTEELNDPLIGLGIAESTREIQQMIEAVDKDGTGEIEFEEFLMIIKDQKLGHDAKNDSKINKFFKDMSNGKIGSQDLNFHIIVQDIRRRYMMNGLLGNEEEKKYGQVILNNVKQNRI